jgi:probable HAF family extracellular repeat protein
MLDRTRIASLSTVLLLAGYAAQAQTQASCNFNLIPMFPSSPANSQFVAMGGNDFGTVVGRVYFSHTTPQLAIQAFIRYSGGGITYYTYPNSVYNQFNQFTARNNNGTNLLMVEPAGEYDYILQGSSMTKIVVPNSQWRSTHATAINKYNSVVGTYGHLDGYQGGFKRYSNGKFVDLTYPGSVATFPYGINDKGTIVGSYLDSNYTEHGFIYSNGSWATLDDPSNKTGRLLGISNTGVIVGGFTPFLYENGAFKLISVPNNPTAYIDIRAMTPGGLIIGIVEFTPNPPDWYDFTAKCQ